MKPLSPWVSASELRELLQFILQISQHCWWTLLEILQATSLRFLSQPPSSLVCIFKVFGRLQVWYSSKKKKKKSLVGFHIPSSVMGSGCQTPSGKLYLGYRRGLVSNTSPWCLHHPNRDLLESHKLKGKYHNQHREGIIRVYQWL